MLVVRSEIVDQVYRQAGSKLSMVELKCGRGWNSALMSERQRCGNDAEAGASPIVSRTKSSASADASALARITGLQSDEIVKLAAVLSCRAKATPQHGHFPPEKNAVGISATVSLNL